MSKEKLISVVVVVLVVAVVASVIVFGGAGKTKNSLINKTPNMATVNGVPITKEAYDAQLALTISSFKGQGVDVLNADKLAQIKIQVLNDLINNELVNQEIVKAGIKITPESVEVQYQALLNQAGGADKLKIQLNAAKLTEAGLRANIAKQLAVQAYLLQHIDMSTATATPAEIAKFYADNTKGQKNTPLLKNVSEQIRQQLVASKQQLLITTFLASLRQNATIATTTTAL